MTLTRKTIVRTIGQRTRLPNPQVELMLEALIDLWMEALEQGERIELEDFMILEAIWVRHSGGGRLRQGQAVKAGYKVMLRARPGKKLHQLLKERGSPEPDPDNSS